jgi:hypothetical protein
MIRLSLIILTLTLLLSPDSASGSAISFEDYLSRLRRTLESVKSGEGPMAPEEVDRVKGLFPIGLMVKVREGSEVTLNREGLLRWMEEAGKSAEGRASLARHLEAVLLQADRRPPSIPATDHDWERSREKLEAIYGMGEFRGLREKEPPPWLGSLLEWLQKLGNRLHDAFKTMGGRIPGEWIGYVLCGLLLPAAGFFLFWVIRRFGPAGWTWRSPSVTRASPSAKTPEGDWRQWRQKAMEKASHGAFREAVRFFFVSVLMEGHHHGWWTYYAEATNREHLARMKGPSKRRDALKHLVALYERVWYGQEEAGQASFRRCSEWRDQMEAPL